MPALPLPSAGPRSLLAPVAMLAGVVVVLAGIWWAGSLVATVAFAALAAVVCREVQLALLRRGVRRWLALTLTVTALVLVIGSLAVAFALALVALAAELSGEAATLQDELRALADAAASTVGLPGAEVPSVDVETVVAALRSLLALVAPAVTGLAMAVLIATYLLYDADRLRARMLAAAPEGAVARYDALATELVTYVKVRAVLGAAAAVADTVLLLVLGLPYAVLWGVVSFLFSFVPNIGFVLALIPPTILAFIDGGVGAALVVVAGYVLINLAFDYVLQPRVMATQLAISPVVTITCILVWTFLIGPMGALLAVPLTIALRALLLPFPGARWFVGLLGPIPADEDPAAPGERAAEPTIGA